MRFTLRVVLCALFLVPALSTFAQAAPPASAPRAAAEYAVYKGIPYSATRVFTRKTTHADGSVATLTLRSLLWQDAEGRLRHEDVQADGSRTVNLDDPVAKMHYSWNQGEHVQTMVMVAHYSPDRKEVDFGPGEHVSAQPLTKPMQPLDPNMRVELLPPASMLGVAVERTRNTQSFPAGHDGATEPYTMSWEHWRSPELHLALLTVIHDSRGEETRVEYTELRRDAPDPALFQPPAGARRIEVPAASSR